MLKILSSLKKKIYLLTLNKLDTKPSESIFIDDKQEYIQGARNLGINAILFKTPKDLLKKLNLYSININ